MSLFWVMAFRVATLFCVVVPIVVIGIDAISGSPAGGVYLLYAPAIVALAGVGWLVIERRPGNAVGPLLLVVGFAFALFMPADLSLHLAEDLPGAAFAALFITTLDAPMLVVLGLILLLFPDGRVPSRRWRWCIPVAAASIAFGVVGFGLQPGPNFLYPEYDNPIGVPGFPGQAAAALAYGGMLVILVAAAAALVGRWRRGDPIVRAQIKWVAAAAIVMLVTESVNIATFDPANLNALTVTLATIGIALVPVAIGIAILRYRLYEIDRIISRTISWAVVTASVVGLYLGGVLILQGALSGFTQEDTLAVAGSTLIAAAAFQPLRRRIQGVVDRRFHRARYDAERTASAFAERVRDEVDLVALGGSLESTVRAATAPRSVGLWLRESER